MAKKEDKAVVVKGREVEMSGNRIGELYEATRMLGKKILPDGKSVGLTAQYVAVFRQETETLKDEQKLVQDSHMPKEGSMPTASEGDPILITDPLGMKRKLEEIMRAPRKVILPMAKFTEAMMPKSLATKPENVEGLGEIQGLMMPELMDFPVDTSTAGAE